MSRITEDYRDEQIAKLERELNEARTHLSKLAADNLDIIERLHQTEVRAETAEAQLAALQAALNRIKRWDIPSGGTIAERKKAIRDIAADALRLLEGKCSK